MARKASSENGGVNRSLEGKDLAPWLAKRFADLALPLTRASTIGSAKLPLTPDSRQRHPGNSSDTLAGQVINRNSLVFAARRVTRLPLTSGLSAYILRKLALVRTEWQQVPGLSLVRRHRRPERGAKEDTHAPTSRQPASDGGSWPQNGQPFRQGPSLPFSAQDHLAGRTARIYPSVTKEPLRSITALSLTQPATTKERISPSDEIPRRIGPAAESSRYTHIRPMPLIIGPMAVRQQMKDTDVSESSRGSRSGTSDRGTYVREQPRTVDLEQVDDSREEPTQVRPQPRHAGLARLSPPVLPPIIQRATLQRSLQDRGPDTSPGSTIERHAHAIRAAYQPEETRAHAQASRLIARQGTAPFTASAPAAAPSDETTVHAEHTLPDMTVSKRPTKLLSKALHNLQRSLSKPSRASGVSSKLDEPTVPRMLDEHEATQSALSQAEAGYPNEVAEAAAYPPPPQPAVQEGQASWGEARISRSMGHPGLLSLDSGANSHADRGPTEGHTVRRLPYRSSTFITGSAITPLSVTRTIPGVMTGPSRQLFRAGANLPVSAGSEEHRFPQDRDRVPSSPGYTYARHPALTLPVISRTPAGEDSGAASSAELFRYTSEAMPQISHSRNHNGLDLALATAGRATETRAEAQATAPEHREEKGEEERAAPDIKALAREIYPLIKRMIMIERDRHPTWY